MKHKIVKQLPAPRVQGSTRVINLSGYQTPEVKEVYGKDWILYENGDGGDYLGNAALVTGGQGIFGTALREASAL